MPFVFTSVPSLTRPLTFDTDCESFFGELPAYQANLEALAAQAELNATTLLSIDDIVSYMAAQGLTFTADGKGIILSDGSKIIRNAAGGMVLVPYSDSFPVIVRNAANNADVFVLAPCTNAEAVAGISTTQAPSAASMRVAITDRLSKVAIYIYETLSGTAGGTAISGSWLDLPLWSEIVDGIGASLSSPKVTLPAGNYLVDWVTGFEGTGHSQSRLVYDCDGSPGYIYGKTVRGNTTSSHHIESTGYGYFYLSGTMNIKLQYRVQTSCATYGLGNDPAFGNNNIHRILKIKKL